MWSTRGSTKRRSMHSNAPRALATVPTDGGFRVPTSTTVTSWSAGGGSKTGCQILCFALPAPSVFLHAVTLLRYWRQLHITVLTSMIARTWNLSEHGMVGFLLTTLSRNERPDSRSDMIRMSPQTSCWVRKKEMRIIDVMSASKARLSAWVVCIDYVDFYAGI